MSCDRPRSLWTVGELRRVAAMFCVGISALTGANLSAAGPSKLEYTLPAVSPLAQKRLESASDFLAVRQWTEAFQVIDEVVREHRGTLVEAEPGRWISVPRRIAELTAELPPEGLNAWRRRVDLQAAELLLEANMTDGPGADVAAAPLERIVDEFFASSAGDDALRQLGMIRWRAGDPAGARELWSQLLPEDLSGSGLRYPQSGLAPATILARLDLCDLLLGDRLAASRRTTVLRERFPDATGEIAGERGRLADLLDRIIAPREGSPGHEKGNVTRPVEPLPWVLTGDSCPRRIGPRLWSQSLPASPAGKTLEVTRIPALWKERCVVADNERVLVLEAETGQPAWPSGMPGDDGRIFEGEGDRRFTVNDARPWPQPLFRPAIDARGRCFCRVGVSGEPNRLSLLKSDASRVVAFDLAHGEGRLLWSTPADTLPGEAHWLFAGSPLSVDENVLCVVRAAGTQALCGVASLDPSSGAVRWVQPVCTVIAEQDPLWGREVLRPESGRVFLNLIGLVAALRLTDGRLEWLRRNEDRPEQELSRERKVATLQPFVAGGRVYSMTNDRRIECLDAVDGRRHWGCETPGLAHAVVAASEGVVVVAGDSLWGIDASTGRLLWRFGYDDPEGRGAGPGAVIGLDVLWSTREDLFTVDLQTGQPLRRVPLAEDQIRGGALITGERQLLMSSPVGISLFRLAPCGGE